jgi:uncharacterized protein YndB with AHSA1/START domain
LAGAASGALKTARRLRDGHDGGTIAVTASRSSRLGSVAVQGDHATITFERRMRHPVEEVWKALTEPEHLARWYVTEAVIEGRTGGSIDLRMGPGQLHVTGRILAWEPPYVFEYEWKVQPWQGMPKGEEAVVRWELRPEGRDTLLTLTHRNLTRRSALGAMPSMHVVLDRLATELAGEPLGDFRTAVAEVQGLYSGHQDAQ